MRPKWLGLKGLAEREGFEPSGQVLARNGVASCKILALQADTWSLELYFLGRDSGGTRPARR